MAMISETRTMRIGFLDRLTAFATTIGDFRRKRLTMRDLEALDDHALHDIGLTRTDMLNARFAPSSSDPLEVLRRARMRNIG